MNQEKTENLNGTITDEELRFSHKFCLEEPYRLTCISRTLCELLGYSTQEIAKLFGNRYSPMVHPDDRDRYLQYIRRLASGEQTLALRYRMIRKDKEVIYVNDIMFSHKKKDGKLYGFAVIVDITDSIEYHSVYSMMNLSSVLPFGYLQCTCSRYPKVLCINDQMLDFLGASKTSSDWQDFLRENIYFMIPFEERDRFRSYLSQALETTEPIKIRHRIVKSDGSLATVIGWLGTIVNQLGELEYSIIYTETEKEAVAGRPTDNSYFRALERAYNVIFEVNFDRQTVECLYGRDTSDLGKLYDVRMTLDSAVAFWINNYIVPEDRSAMQRYLQEILTPGYVAAASPAPQIEFRIVWDDQVVYCFIGVAISLDASTILFCCRDTAKVQYSSLQAREIRAMKKLHQFMDRKLQTSRKGLGAVILQLDENEHCSLVYASQSIFNYLNIRYDQYLHYVEEGFPFALLEDLAHRYGIPDMNAFLQGSEPAHLKLPDYPVPLLLTCSSSLPNFYEMMLLEENAPLVVAGIPSTGIFARTFGYFDLFVDGSPVVFSSQKEKEFMALLIDRNGGTITSADAIGILWEDELPDEKVKTRFRKLAMSLRRTLEHYGIDHILINRNGVRSVDVTAFTCDYYELLAGNSQYVQSFHNSYMSDYPWSERTLGTLWDFS